MAALILALALNWHSVQRPHHHKPPVVYKCIVVSGQMRYMEVCGYFPADLSQDLADARRIPAPRR